MTSHDSVEDVPPSPERNETPAEKLDRNWSELLQELRVTQTGIQILVGFLLTLPFQARFGDLDPVLVWVFLTAVVFSMLATALMVAPVTAHRLLFRRHAKDLLVRSADTMAKAGLAFLALAVVAALTLIFGFVLDVTSGLIAGGLGLAVFLVLWLVVPLRLARTHRSEDAY